MAFLEFFSKEDVFSSFQDPSNQELGKVYFAKNRTLKLGEAAFSDILLTTKLETDRWYGLKNYNGKNMAFRVDTNGRISEITEKTGVELGWMSFYPFDTPAKAKQEMTEMAAAGCTKTLVIIELGKVFNNIDEYNANATTSWTTYDDLIGFAAQKFDKVAIRICCDYDDTLFYDLTANPIVPKANPLFNLFTDIAQDEWGNPGRIARGSGHASFAKDSARAKMVGFVQKVVQRYNPILADKWDIISFGNAAQQEMGNNYENQFYDSNGNLSTLKKALFDYHPDNQLKFQAYCKKNYVTLKAAGNAHGKVYNDWNEIVPPKTGKSSLLNTTDEDIYNLLRTPLGLDFYKHDYEQMRNFWVECIAIINRYAPNALVCAELGSGTDKLAALRKTYNIPDMATIFKVIKPEFSGINWNGTVNVSAAIIANNAENCEIHVEMNENDVKTQGGIIDPTQLKASLFAASKSAKAHGATTIWIIADKNSIYYENTKAMVGELKTWITENPNYKVSSGQQVNLPISKLIQNYDGAIADCVAAGLNTGITNRPIVKLIQDI